MTMQAPSWHQFDFPKLVEIGFWPRKLILTNQTVKPALLESVSNCPGKAH